jgi:hypothetical protein
MMLPDLQQPEIGHETEVRPADELAAELLRAGQPLRIKARGGSMLPFVRGGDVVIVAPTPPSAVSVGDVICYESPPGRLFLHRMIRRQGDRFLTKGDALRFSESIDAPAVLGTVVAIERDGRVAGWDSGPARCRNRAVAFMTRLIPPMLAIALPVRRLLRAACRG